MGNLASSIKEEITRLARKEIKAATTMLRKHTAQHRTEIAAYKRRTTDLERQVKSLEKTVSQLVKAQPAPEAPASAPTVRFTAKGFKSLRKRLDLSAAQVGLIVGATGQTVYGWENGTRPRKQHLPALAALRGLSKTEAHAIVASRI